MQRFLEKIRKILFLMIHVVTLPLPVATFLQWNNKSVWSNEHFSIFFLPPPQYFQRWPRTPSFRILGRGCFLTDLAFCWIMRLLLS